MPEAYVRVGYIGYRDCEPYANYKRFDILDFTDNIDAVKEEIGKSEATGGRGCEDIIGALS